MKNEKTLLSLRSSPEKPNLAANKPTCYKCEKHNLAQKNHQNVVSSEIKRKSA